MILPVRDIIARKMRKFRSDNEGSATVEALLWVPILGYFMIMIADFSFIFYGKAQALQLMQDHNRVFATGQYNSAVQTQNAITAAYARMSPSATTVTTSDGGIITTTMTVPAGDLVSVGSIPFINRITLTIVAQRYQETWQIP